MYALKITSNLYINQSRTFSQQATEMGLKYLRPSHWRRAPCLGLNNMKFGQSLSQHCKLISQFGSKCRHSIFIVHRYLHNVCIIMIIIRSHRLLLSIESYATINIINVSFKYLHCVEYFSSHTLTRTAIHIILLYMYITCICGLWLVACGCAINHACENKG